MFLAQMKTKNPKKIARRGQLLNLLLTSRGTQRYVIPKGWQMKGKSDQQAAALEAKQEAGVTGEIEPAPVGTYQYWKRLKNAFIPITVTVYALEVGTELSSWKERGQRQRAWLTSQQAASLVDEPELASLLAGFQPRDPVAS